jgi:Flp pilus assembly protein TadG
MNSLRRFLGRDGEEGQAVVMFAIIMLALLFAVGLAIDAGQLYTAKRTEQEAADAAAFAGAVVIYQNGLICNAACETAAVAAAVSDATKNGYTNGVASTVVTVNLPPASGAYVGNRKHVEVIITRQVQTSLVPAQAAFNPVRARGVAGSEELNNDYAIMALDRSNNDNAFWTGPNGDLHLNGGGILVNSSNSSAARNEESNAARFTIQSPHSLDVTGGATGSWGSIGIPVNAGHIQLPDPFAGMVTPPTTGALWGCATCSAPVWNSMPADGILRPGIHTYEIGGPSNTQLTMLPGIYILRAGIDTSGQDGVTGVGVLMFNTYSNYPAAPGANPTCGSIELTGQADFDLTAMTTGTWKNMLVYQDAYCANEMKIGGNGSFQGTGSVYLPTGHFRFDGNNATLTGSQLVANTVEIENGNITIDFNPTTTAQPILPRLSE